MGSKWLTLMVSSLLCGGCGSAQVQLERCRFREVVSIHRNSLSHNCSLKNAFLPNCTVGQILLEDGPGPYRCHPCRAFPGCTFSAENSCQCSVPSGFEGIPWFSCFACSSCSVQEYEETDCQQDGVQQDRVCAPCASHPASACPNGSFR